MTLAQYLHILRKRWLTVASLTALGALIAVGLTMMMPKVYTATAKNFVSVHASGSQTTALSQSSEFALANVASFAGLASSPTVLQPVINQLGLQTTPAQLAKHISATNPAGTVLITIEANSDSPRQARALADAVSHELATKVEKLTMVKGGNKAQVSMAEATPANAPSTPSSPRPILNVGLGLLLGLFVGACAAVLRDRLDTSVRSAEQLQDISGVALLGAVPHDGSTPTQPLLALRDNTLAVESFRTIRTNLRFVNVDKPPRQIVITSAVSGEGKTVTACNLALTLAQGARRVCLVEADLRRPKACTYLGINGAIGMTDVVAGQLLLEDVLVPWNHGQITVLPAGTVPPDPSQLLGAHAVRDIFDQLLERFDVVVIDSPPVLPVSDAAVLSAISDGTVIVARHGKTHRDNVATTVETLQKAHAHLIGTVLTDVKSRRRNSAYLYRDSNYLDNADRRGVQVEPARTRESATLSEATAPADSVDRRIEVATAGEAQESPATRRSSRHSS